MGDLREERLAELVRVAIVARKILDAWKAQEARAVAWQQLAARARASAVTSSEWEEIQREHERLDQPRVTDFSSLRVELGEAFGE